MLIILKSKKKYILFLILINSLTSCKVSYIRHSDFTETKNYKEIKINHNSQIVVLLTKKVSNNETIKKEKIQINEKVSSSDTLKNSYYKINDTVVYFENSYWVKKYFSYEKYLNKDLKW